MNVRDLLDAEDAQMPTPMRAADLTSNQDAVGDSHLPDGRLAGPLLAVCATAGGAGASTLAYLTARSIARAADDPVLVCDTGGPTAGLAAYARIESPRSLSAASDVIAAGEELSDGLFAVAADGIRLIARRPELRPEADERALERLLGDAREQHQITVVDCGTLARATERVALRAATHLAWVMPATARGMRRARAMFRVVPYDSSRPELIVARADPDGRRASTSDLAELAGERGATLVLFPRVPALGEDDDERALEEASVALDAIGSLVVR